MPDIPRMRSTPACARMGRHECLKVLAAYRTNEIVVSVFQSAFDWLAVSPGDLNYTFIGAMGQAASHGLGLALAFPERRVIVLDGDGSLLMNLGCLVTIANVAPRNLIHFVCNNAMYETTGGQPTPGCDRINLAGIARGAGYAVVREFDEVADFDEAVPALLSAEGPVFADLKIVPSPELPQNFAMLHSSERMKAFKRALTNNQI
ncbi:MAG: thiamine pyrophosphate-dependent enzyme [Dehalococcoidia bacterium]|nr:thiamine pyrophosphate-dependent enzyme [Dehalococcoidia bacterium]